MKRMICLVLALCVVISSTLCLFSCEAFDTPQTMVTKAVAKTAMQNSYEGTILMEMSFEILGIPMGVMVEGDIKTENVHSDNAEIQMDMSLKAMGTSTQMTTYFKDGWSYVVSDGGRYKTKNDDGIEADDTVDSFLQQIPANLFEGVEIVKDEDGTRSVTLEIPTEVFSELYDDLVDELTGTLGADIEFTVSDAVVKICVKDGLISLYDIDFTMTMEMMGQTLDVDARASVAFTKYGGVKVEMLAGYEGFEEQR